MKTIKLESVNKVLDALIEMQNIANSGEPFSGSDLSYKHKIDSGIPTYAIRIGYFTRSHHNKTIKCNIKKFEPWHARELIKFRNEAHKKKNIDDLLILSKDTELINNQGFHAQIPDFKMQEVLNYLNNAGVVEYRLFENEHTYVIKIKKNGYTYTIEYKSQ